MNYRAHAVGGMLAGVIIMNLSGYGLISTDGMLLITSATLGGLLPDIDHKGSFLGSKFKPVSHVLNKTLGHRGATHAPLILTLILGGLHILTGARSLLFLGILIGSLSHVILDALTIAGIPLFYPFSRTKISLLPLKTGGAAEQVITIMMVLLIFYFSFGYLLL